MTRRTVGLLLCLVAVTGCASAGVTSQADADRALIGMANAWSSHDVDKLLALFIDNCVYEDVTFGVVTRGKSELRGFAEATFKAIPDFNMEVTSRSVAGDRASMEWVMTGTHKGDFPGLPATGKRFSVRGASIVEVQGAKIRRVSDYWDAVTLMRQIGLLPAK
jgi:steroid delta-isomerase-like uncharacterized protein